GKTDGKVAAGLSDNALRDAFRARKTGGTSALRDAEKVAGCALCFPAGTLVATTHGEQAIQTLGVGDTVLSENPATGKVENEAVQAVIQDPVSPLIAVELSDSSAITVTVDHPFWVDAGAQLAGPGWFAAGRLQGGDELRRQRARL
nr:HINT domain-containing protein [Chloroflexota bacterium]